jgi:hypothetical protein
MVVIRGNSIIMLENLEGVAAIDGMLSGKNPNMNRR